MVNRLILQNLFFHQTLGWKSNYLPNRMCVNNSNSYPHGPTYSTLSGGGACQWKLLTSIYRLLWRSVAGRHGDEGHKWAIVFLNHAGYYIATTLGGNTTPILTSLFYWMVVLIGHMLSTTHQRSRLISSKENTIRHVHYLWGSAMLGITISGSKPAPPRYCRALGKVLRAVMLRIGTRHCNHQQSSDYLQSSCPSEIFSTLVTITDSDCILPPCVPP